MRVFDETWRLVTWTRMVSDEEMNPNKIQVPTKETTNLEKKIKIEKCDTLTLRNDTVLTALTTLFR